MTAGAELFRAVHSTLLEVVERETRCIVEAAEATAQRLVLGGMLHVFGTGHSHMMAEELFFRAGGLTAVNAILDPGLMLHVSARSSTELERLEGYAPLVLDRYDLRPEDVFLVVSNSGRNAAPIDAALHAKERGLLVIALTSAGHYGDEPSRHSSGQNLSAVADVVVDTHVPIGDAAVTLPGLDARVGAISTAVGATILQAYAVETVSRMLRAGTKPSVIVSANVNDGGDVSGVFGPHVDRIRHR
jgi:uncharacterized phosphosugar-binding protein